jgi:hypothetical protein
MSRHRHSFEPEIGSEKSFGVVFAIVFALIGLYPLLNGEGIRLWSIVIASVFLGLAYVAPRVLSVPNRLWFRLGILLGGIVAPVIMGIVYILTIIPTGLILRILGKDPLRRSFDADTESYWIERDQPVGSMKDQF